MLVSIVSFLSPAAPASLHEPGTALLGATPLAGNLDQPAHYLDWGPIQISVGNLVMILVIVVLFVLALVLPFPKGRRRP